MSTAARPRVVAGLRLVAPVGRGAEGEVWEARDARGRRRALKLIRPDSLVPPSEVERRGAWLVEVDHPALARVWRTGVLSGGGLDEWGFVEMDFVDGASLHRAPADPGALARLAPLADALDLLHAGAWSQGVPLVHRDVKPANLIEQTGGGLVLVDHSTLRAADADTITRIGTPLFAAPEVVTGRMGPPADVYSFCATAVALLTGARGAALADLLAHAGELDLPPALRAGLADAPADRPRTCAAALDGPRRDAVDAEPTAAIGAAGAGTPTADPVPPAPPPQEPETAALTEVVPPPPGQPLPAQAAPAGPRPMLGWLLALVLLAAAPTAVLLLGLPLWPDGAVVIAVAAVVHLSCHAVAGVGLPAALLVPPVAWGFLLADRAAPPGRRRDWARPLVTGALLPLAAALLLVARALLARGGGLAPELLAGMPGAGLRADQLAALTAAALGIVALSAFVARRGGVPLRVLLLPLWVAGAAVLLSGVLLLPFALVAGRAVGLLRLLGRTLAGLAAVARPEPRARAGGA